MEGKNKILLGAGLCILIVILGYVLFSGDGNGGVEPPPVVPNVTPPALNETVNVSINETGPVNGTINETVNITIPVSNYTTEEEVELLHEMAAYNPNRTTQSKVGGGVVMDAVLRLKYLETKDPKYLGELERFGAYTGDLLRENANASNVMQRVHVEFKQKPPKPEDLEVLRKMGVKMDFEMCSKHPTPSCAGRIPLDKIYEIVMLDFVKQIDSGEAVVGEWLDDSVPAINADALHNLSFNGSGIRVAVILILILYFLIFAIIKFNIIKIQQKNIIRI